MFWQFKSNLVIKCSYKRLAIDETQGRAFKTKNISVLADDDLDMTIINTNRKTFSGKDSYVGKHTGSISVYTSSGILIILKK